MKSLLLPLELAMIGTLLVACSGQEIRINPATRSLLATQQEIVAIHYSPSPFAAQTPEVRNAASAGMLFGAIGGAIAGAVQAGEAKQVGSQLVRDYGLEDPILKIKRSFLDAISRSSNLDNLNSVQEALVDDDRASLRKKFQKDFVFDFKTTAWSLNPLPLSPNSYRVQYSGRARLLSFPEGKIEWQGECEADGKIENSAPTLLQLVANSGAILKSQLDSASDACSDQLERQFVRSTP
ncbi:MAG: hypothetical protein AAB242_14210 [Nitrospirota bacterium]